MASFKKLKEVQYEVDSTLVIDHVLDAECARIAVHVQSLSGELDIYVESLIDNENETILIDQWPRIKTRTGSILLRKTGLILDKIRITIKNYGSARYSVAVKGVNYIPEPVVHDYSEIYSHMLDNQERMLDILEDIQFKLETVTS